MESTNPIIFEQPLREISGVKRASEVFFSLSIAVNCIVLPMYSGLWYLLLLVFVFGVLYVLAVIQSKAQLKITRSADGELHLIIEGNKTFLQGVIVSFNNWTFYHRRNLISRAYQHCMELKISGGDIGLVSKKEYSDAGGLEMKDAGLSGDYPKYFIKDINPLIEVLESNGVEFFSS